MAQSLEGKVVLITGASSGIGAATARLLAELGCKLALAARRKDRLEALAAELATETLSLEVDVTHADDVARMVERTLEHFGRIDVLFANAGIYIPGEVAEGDPDAWAHLMDVNINGVLRSVRAVLPHMMAQKSGDVVVTSSISGLSISTGNPSTAPLSTLCKVLSIRSVVRSRHTTSVWAQLRRGWSPTNCGGLKTRLTSTRRWQNTPASPRKM